ncbi:MAG: hypothetical protein ACNA8W_08845 [Bradymonadaceae bacterium]
MFFLTHPWQSTRRFLGLLVLIFTFGACATADAGAEEDTQTGPDASTEDTRAPDAAAEDVSPPLVDADFDGGDDDTTNVPDVGEDPDPLDLTQGAWTLENVSQTEGIISNSPTMAFLPDGSAWIAWAEPNPGLPSDQDIWVAHNKNGAWEVSPHTVVEGVQLAFTSLLAVDDTMVLVFSGYPDGDHNVFVSIHDGNSWSENQAVAPTEGLPRRRNYSPVIRRSDSGEFAIAYLSEPANAMNYKDGPAQVRVLRFTDFDEPGQPETVIAAGDENCLGLDAAFDGSGKLHVVGSCGNPLSPTLFYATESIGPWTELAPTAGTAGYGSAPSIALGPDDDIAHIVWVGGAACDGSTCTTVFYQRIEGGLGTQPVPVSGSPEMREHRPAITIDEDGRVLVVYHRFNEENRPDMYFTWAGENTGFTAPHNLSAAEPEYRDQAPDSIVFHPETGHPHFVFYRTFPGTSPLTSEIMLATWSP